MTDDYTDEEYEAWLLTVEKFLANWPYDGMSADPPSRPTRKGERGWDDDWRKKLR